MTIELEIAEQEQQQTHIVALWTPADVARLLTTLRESLTADLAENRIRQARDAVNLLIERIVYDLESRQFVIYYRLTGFKRGVPKATQS